MAFHVDRKSGTGAIANQNVSNALASGVHVASEQTHKPIVDVYNRVFARDDLQKAPPSYQVNGSRAVFVDIAKVDADVEFDVSERETTVKATVAFTTKESGKPIIELVPSEVAKAFIIDSEGQRQEVSLDEVSPPGAVRRNKHRIVNAELEAGTYTLEVEYRLEAGVNYGSYAVSFFQNMSDLYSRGFSELFWPTSFEYDQYEKTLNVQIIGTDHEHRVRANGNISSTEKNKFVINFPNYYNTASFFIDIHHKSRFSEVVLDYTSVDGRTIPIRVYGSRVALSAEALGLDPKDVPEPEVMMNRAAERARDSIERFERMFGPYHFDQYLVRHDEGMNGGMEYAGATITNLRALEHETQHQWFARAVMPVNGNDGWIDEAIASWGDDGYRMQDWRPQRSTLRSKDLYRRQTTRNAYYHGQDVIEYLNYIFREKSSQESLVPVLKKWYIMKVGQTISTEEFEAFLIEEASTEEAKQMIRKTFDICVFGGAREGTIPVPQQKVPHCAWKYASFE